MRPFYPRARCALVLAVSVWQAFAAAPAAAAGGAFSGRYAGYNVILISITGLGANRMSLYGYSRPTTPKLDAWAKEAVVFENAYTHASWTLPAAVSLLTSMYPYTHGIWRRDFKNNLSARVPTLPELLRDNGYATAAFTGGLDYHPSFSQLRGFQSTGKGADYSGFDSAFPGASRWLAGRPEKKFFLLIQGYSLHCPYDPPAPYKGTFGNSAGKPHTVDNKRCVRGFAGGDGAYKAFYSGGCWSFTDMSGGCKGEDAPVNLTQNDIDYLSDLYDDSVLRADSLVGEFLASLKPEILKKTIIIITADHGEMFAKHGRFGRAGTRRGTHYDDVLHIPLLIRLPGTAHRRPAGLVQYIDVMPTILDALGLKAPATAQGLSLKPLITGEKGRVNEYVYSGLPYNVNSPGAENNKMFPFRTVTETVRGGRWKLIHETVLPGPASGSTSEKFELYDLARDPEELSDVFKDNAGTAGKLWLRLRNWGRKARSFPRPGPVTGDVSPDLLKNARERGYWQ